MEKNKGKEKNGTINIIINKIYFKKEKEREKIRVIWALKRKNINPGKPKANV